MGVLEDRLGVPEGGLPDKVSESDLLDSFKTSLKQRSKELPCFGAGVMSSEDWWEEVVRATFRGAGVSDKTLGIDEGRNDNGGSGGIFDDVFGRLFHDVFTSTTAWELVPVRLSTVVGLPMLYYRSRCSCTKGIEVRSRWRRAQGGGGASPGV